MSVISLAKKLNEKVRDIYFISRHTNFLRGIIESRSFESLEREKEDEGHILIAFYPTGGFGDGIISSKLLDELMTLGPVRIDVFCNNIAFGQAVYGKRPGVRVLPHDAYEHSKYIYDIALTVEHFVHVDHYNAKNVAKYSPALADKIHALGVSISKVRPDIGQQCYREALHFERCKLLGINRYTELNHINVFHITDQRSAVYLDENYLLRLEELDVLEKKYITINRGADSMGRSGTQTKVWPEEYYIEFVKLFKQQYPDIEIYQIGSKGNTKIVGVDKYIFGENLEVVKWILKNSKLHLDCEGGMVHLASQLSTKCVVIFGPTPAHIYAYPWNINLVPKNCNNCMGIHEDWAFTCYRGLPEPECMYSITADMVMNSIKDYMDNKKEKSVQEIQLDYQKIDNISTNIEEEIELITRNNKLISIVDKDKKTLMELHNSVDFSSMKEKNVLVLNPKRSIIPWYLMSKQMKVSIVDEDFGWDGRIEDVSHCEYMRSCKEAGIEVRFGSELCIPYGDSVFDFIIYENMSNKSKKNQLIRVLNEYGTIITV